MGNQASQLSDEPGFAGAGKDLAHFDHFVIGLFDCQRGGRRSIKKCHLHK